MVAVRALAAPRGGRFRFAFCACARPCASGPACPPRRKAGALDSSYYKRARRRPTTPCPPSCARDFPAVRPLCFARRLILRPRPALLRPVPRRFPRLRNDAAAAPCPPPAPRALTDFARPPPRARPAAAKTLPYRHTFSIGPGLRAGEARPRRPAPHAPQAGGKPPYFGRFCPFAAPPSGRAHPHKSIAKKWKIFMECSLQFLSIFTNLFYNESSTQPRSGRARAPDGGVGRTFSGQIVPFVHRSRFPSPVFRLPGTRAIPPPGRRRADASVVSFVRPLHAERLRPQAPPGVQHHIGKGECL